MDANTNIGVEIRLSAGYSSTLSVIRVVAGRVRGAAQFEWGRAKSAACNAFAEKAMERSAEARSAEALQKGEARRAEPTWRSLHAEARRAEGRGPKGRGEILGVVNLWGNGSELYSGSPQVIMPKGVSQGTTTSRCRPLTVSETFRHTDLYYLLVLCLYRA